MINSVANPKIRELVKLHRSKHRRLTQRFLVENDHLVAEALKSQNLLELYVTQSGLIDFEPQYLISEAVAKKLSQTQSLPQMIGVARRSLGKALIGNVLLLEDIQDPGNVGTLLRSALSFGYQTVVLTEGCAEVTNDKVVRSSQGALFHLNLMEMSTEVFLRKAKKSGYTLLASVVGKGEPLSQIKVGKHAVLLGNEGSGLKKTTSEACDLKLTIPTKAFESLNVAIAGSIIMYELSELI